MLDFAFEGYWTYDICRYDFDRDGFVKKEDVRLVLSHIPIEKTVVGGAAIVAEGTFTRGGGGK